MKGVAWKTIGTGLLTTLCMEESKYVKIADFLVSIPISIKRLGGWTNMFVLVAGNFKECQWWKETVDF